MYLCDRIINFASFYAFSIGLWDCSDIVVPSVFHFITPNLYNNIHLSKKGLQHILYLNGIRKV